MIFEEKNTLITARASVAIYLVLDSLKTKGNVTVPANLCYAGIYPVLYADMTPVFCDVDSLSGNTTLELFKKSITKETVAAIVPHMYGNPVKDMPKIAEFCKSNNIVLIEDCASAMGATASYELGEMGDYTVYSTGYSKTLDLGIGGILYSKKHSLDEMRKKEVTLPDFSEESEKNFELFSKLYRLLRNNGNGCEIEKSIYKSLPIICKNGFLHRISNDKAKWIREKLLDLDNVIDLRRDCLERYKENLKDSGLKIYEYENGAVPWRFNFYIDSSVRKEFISKCLENNLPISDWYPCVMPMFGYEELLSGAVKHEKSILNLPIPLSKEKIDSYCNTIINILKNI